MGPVEDATREEIAQLGTEKNAPGLVAIAIGLAQQFDGADAPTAAAVVGRELRAVMADVRKLAPAKEEGDWVDDLNGR